MTLSVIQIAQNAFQVRNVSRFKFQHFWQHRQQYHLPKRENATPVVIDSTNAVVVDASAVELVVSADESL